ncbi:hypothetical protein CMQ_1398 [Grosmannia clavigera kw1407]|uniref:DUF7732 domain-containing protein n=1 Tax=Grosmannia clavigera (strain kw1407 / UAMH 11150) TaxID=655863 RepID=F0XCH5_GROCL|nr:uncharacterized protein CMQ_1398 [Grosmannia clavigera kw1407]EFX04470.1 hypothetical protein CMQ_1398 [Grosmannia clavigera kw1407]
MKLSRILLLMSAAAPLVGAAAVPDIQNDDAVPALVLRFSPASEHDATKRDEPAWEYERLFRRKGGGGSSGGGGGRSGGGSGKGSSSSSSGGRTTTGSGTKPAYGGGAYYGGGSTVPYRSGSTSPSGIAPLALGVGAGLAIGSSTHFWPGYWYHPIYYYPYSHPYAYLNQTSNRNETKNVACACDETVECGCDNNSNSTYFADLLGNGSYAALNASGVAVADVNGTSTLLINGTLPNGTTAAGGTESASAAGGSLRELREHAGLVPAIAAMLAMVYVL